MIILLQLARDDDETSNFVGTLMKTIDDAVKIFASLVFPRRVLVPVCPGAAWLVK